MVPPGLSDALTIYFRSTPDYAKRIGERVTVFLSMDEDELVGCRIKGVKRVLDDIKWFDVSISDGSIDLKILFLSLRGNFDDNDDAREFYRKLGEMVSETNLTMNSSETSC